EQRLHPGGPDDELQILPVEAYPSGVDDLDPDVAGLGPVGVEPRPEDPGEAAIDPDQRPAVVLEVDHLGERLQGARLDDQVEPVADEPGGPHRGNLDLDPAE